MKVLDAHFASNLDRKTFLKWLNKPKETQPNAINYLQNNKQTVIDKYKEYPKKVMYDHRIKYDESINNLNFRYNERLKEYERNLKRLQSIQEGKEVHCLCGGKLSIKKSEYGHFVGCSNYLDKSVIHDNNCLTYLSEPSKSNLQTFTEWLDGRTIFSKQYISHFRTFADLPKWIKASVLFEWLIGNDQEIYNEELSREYYQTSRANFAVSKIQENVCKSILCNIFEKVHDQQLLMVKFEGFDFYQYRVPDFICQNDLSIYVIELKKGIYNINDEQVQEYKDALKIIADKSNLNKTVKSLTVLYDKEDGKLPENTIHIQNLPNHEFN
jgi:ssDNA-binding Zn-finger/Zn-ribbon topoisomerase 1